MIFAVFKLTSDEPFVFLNHEGFFGARSVEVIFKLNQDAILAVEDDLTDPNIFVKNNVDFDNLLVIWELKPFVVVVLSACSASLPVTQVKPRVTTLS